GLARGVRLQTGGREDCGRVAAIHRSGNREDQRMKKYVVTGGAGFIGSALVRGLIARGDGDVHVIDNLLSGSKRSLQEIWTKMELHITDIRNYEEIFPIVRGASVVFHLAAIPSVPRSIHEPVPSH